MMRRIAFLFAFALPFATACHAAPLPPDQAIQALHDPDPDTRRQAADSLRSDTEAGVPARAVPELLAALQSEPDPEVQGAILVTLGRSGAPEARAPIQQALVAATDPRMHRWAERAWKYWRLQTGDIPENPRGGYWNPYRYGTQSKIGPQ